MSKPMKKIFAVDDNLTDILISKIILKKTFPGHEIVMYSKPNEALEYLLENAHDLPEIIILDINMPLVSGWDIVEKLSALNIPANVFMLTSSIFKEDYQQSKKYPIVKDFFVKPINTRIIERLKTFVSQTIHAD
jgi:CheY-like chemotaxis protein